MHLNLTASLLRLKTLENLPESVLKTLAREFKRRTFHTCLTAIIELTNPESKFPVLDSAFTLVPTLFTAMADKLVLTVNWVTEALSGLRCHWGNDIISKKPLNLSAAFCYTGMLRVAMYP